MLLLFIGGIPAAFVGGFIVGMGGSYYLKEDGPSMLTDFLVAFSIVVMIIASLYSSAANGWGGTPGKRAFGLRVRDITHDKEVGFWRGLARFLVSILGAMPLCLGWLWMLWDDQNQTWHDKAAGSIVVRTR